MITKEINGTYGRSKNPTIVFICEDRRQGQWYAAEGSKNINFTYDEIKEGQDIEELQDVDTFTWNKGINSIEDLIEAVEA